MYVLHLSKLLQVNAEFLQIFVTARELNRDILQHSGELTTALVIDGGSGSDSDTADDLIFQTK